MSRLRWLPSFRERCKCEKREDWYRERGCDLGEFEGFRGRSRTTKRHPVGRSSGSESTRHNMVGLFLHFYISHPNNYKEEIGSSYTHKWIWESADEGITLTSAYPPSGMLNTVPSTHTRRENSSPPLSESNSVCRRRRRELAGVPHLWEPLPPPNAEIFRDVFSYFSALCR